MKRNKAMKANEIPEKIYSIPTEGGFYLTAIKPEPPFADGIEYTRTDTFIEKAWNWIDDNLLSSNQQDKSRLYFEQFKKYIKE